MQLSRVLQDRKLPALDGLRAVAAGVVVAFHVAWSAVPGDLGVSAFFVLSGFLITWLLVREWDATGDVSLRRFYLRRTLRIFPAYYAFALLSLAADAYMGERWGGVRVLAVFGYGVDYYNALLHHPVNATTHAWSLAIEEQFYLLWPLSFLWAARRGERVVLGTLAATIVGVLAWRSFLVLVLGLDDSWPCNALDSRLDNLAVGCLLAVLATRGRLDGVAAWLSARPWMPALLVGLLLLSRLGLGHAFHVSAGFTVEAVLVGLIILQLVAQGPTRAWGWLDSRLARWLGAISYPIYLWHIWGSSVGRHAQLGQVADAVVSVLATVALASGSYYLLEKPMLRLRERLEARLPSARRVQPAVRASASAVRTALGVGGSRARALSRAGD